LKVGDLVRWRAFSLNRRDNPWMGPALLVKYDKLMKVCYVLVEGTVEAMRAENVQKWGKRGLDV
jgi:hypothetical protein